MDWSAETAAFYLAGMFDGEGWTQWQEGVHPRIGIANTDSQLIEAMESCLKVLGIEYRKTFRKHKNPKHATLTIIYISTWRGMEKFIDAVPVQGYKKDQFLAIRSKDRKLFPEERPIAEIKRLYWEEGYSWQMIADELGFSLQTIKRWKKEHGLRSRTKGEARKNYLKRGA